MKNVSLGIFDPSLGIFDPARCRRNPDFLGGFPPKPRSVLRNGQGIPQLSGVSSRAHEGGMHPRGQGRKRAKVPGGRRGRKPKMTPHQKREAIHRRDVDGESLADIARRYNVSHATISRLTCRWAVSGSRNTQGPTPARVLSTLTNLTTILQERRSHG